MDNNDILIRLRYALDFKDIDIKEIFSLGGIELSVEEVRKILIKSKDIHNEIKDIKDNADPKEENIKCSNGMLESFLNGLIIYKRGKQDPRQDQPERPVGAREPENPNNMMLKKLKIALSLTSDDILDIFEKTGVIPTKGELSALFRTKGHKNYKECGDKYARNFLRGLTIKYR
jgi:uncharacterized protein YehS (DUF1456 family)